MLSIIKSIPNYEVFYKDIEKDKESYTYQLLKREALLFSRRCDIYGNATRAETFEELNTYLNYSNIESYGFETMMAIQILAFFLFFIPIGLYFQNNLASKLVRDEKVKTYKLICITFLYSILLLTLSVATIVLTQSTGVKILNK